ncbi:MAG: tRNA (cmo5U34)-methyltransferase [Actinomycetota bacterium]|nr:tRNA (cmo5U34)-methyltransferase [Actinomycetota bacterium]
MHERQTAGPTVPEPADPGKNWQDHDYVATWMDRDQHKALLDFPRALTAAILADDEVDPRLIVDIASGPGDYLAVMLMQFPHARGLWADSSPAMLDVAREKLAHFADRIDFQLVDMKSLGELDVPSSTDVVVTSRAAHHLSNEELLTFYASCLGLLRPGGWMANLDHTQPPGTWKERYKRVRRRDQAPRQGPELPSHTHDQAPPTVAEHLEGMTAAGFCDVELVWKTYHTGLFMGRREPS